MKWLAKRREKRAGWQTVFRSSQRVYVWLSGGPFIWWATNEEWLEGIHES